MVILNRCITEEDESFLRSVTFPEEDRQLFTTAPWNGGYRWFRSPNVIPIEHRRQLRARRRSASAQWCKKEADDGNR
jgi:hypothetical protein